MLIFQPAEPERQLESAGWPRPLLIHGRVGSVADEAVLVLARECIQAGRAVVFLAATGTPIRLLQAQLHLHSRDGVQAQQVTAAMVQSLEDSQLVTLYGRPEKLQHELMALADWRRRTVIVAQAPLVIDRSMWTTLGHHHDLVVGGDCTQLKFEVTTVDWKTTLQFGAGPSWLGTAAETWPPYIGLLRLEGDLGQPIIISDQAEF